MEWVCDERPNAVINTLRNVYRWRSTSWWQSLQAKMMKEDPRNHTRWKQKWRWYNRGHVWVKIAKDWAGKEDWMDPRTPSSTHVKKGQQFSNVETARWQVSGSMDNIQWDRSSEDELAKFEKPCTHGGEERLPTLSRRLMTA